MGAPQRERRRPRRHVRLHAASALVKTAGGDVGAPGGPKQVIGSKQVRQTW